MSTEQNKKIFQRLLENSGSEDFSDFDQYISDDVVYRASSGEEAHGKEDFKKLVQSYQKAFSGFELVPQDMIAEGDKVVARYIQRGKQQEEILGIEPSGKEMSLPIIGMVTFKDGKIVELFEMFDTLELMRQLGGIEEETRAGEQPRTLDGGGAQPPA